MKNIIASTLAFFLTLILFILSLPLFIIAFFLAYRRYITRLYTNILLMMSFRRMIEAMIAEEML